MEIEVFNCTTSTSYIPLLNSENDMKSGFRKEIIVGYSDVFDDNESIESLLDGIDKKSLLHASVYFLGFSNEYSIYDDLDKFLSMFFSSGNRDFALLVRAKIYDLGNKSLGVVNIINPISSLELFEHALTHANEKTTLSNYESERNLFKAYLKLNEKNNKKDEIAAKSVNSKVSGNNFEELVFSLSFAYSDLVNYNLDQELINQFYKSILLFEFLESNSRTKGLLDAFLIEFDCKDWQEFLRRLLTIVLPPLKNKADGHTEIVFEKNENYDFEYHCSFIDKLCLDSQELLSDYDYISIRSKPIYKYDEGKYRIIFDLFVCQLLHLGLYFKLSEVNNKLSSPDHISKFRILYTYEFSEKYLAYHVLNSMYSKRKYIKITGSQFEDAKIMGSPDYYVRNGNKVLLFESKDVLINAKTKVSKDYCQYESELRKKFYSDDSRKKPQNKAILQLVSSIEICLDKKLKLDTNYKSKNLRFYPVIICHNAQTDTAGLNKILNKWYNHEIIKLEEKRGIRLNTFPITVINIDSLIYFEDYLNSCIDLYAAIEHYHQKVTFQQKTYKSEDELRVAKEKTLLPFTTVFFNYMREKKMLKPPIFIRDYGFNILKE